MHRCLLAILTVLCCVTLPAADERPFPEVLESLEASDWKQAATRLAAVPESKRNADYAILEARLQLGQRKPADAAKILEAAVKRWPRSADLHNWLGNAYFQQSNDAGMMKKLSLAKKMKKSWLQAVTVDRTHLDARSSLIGFYAQAPGIAGGSFKEARKHAAELRKIDPRRGTRRLAWVEMQDDNPEKAFALWREYMAKHPEDLDARVQLGLLYQQQKDWKNAFATFEEVLAKEADHPSALYQFGRTAIFAETRMAEGAGKLQAYLEIEELGEGQPSKAWAWHRLGLIQEKLGDRAAAKASHQAALDQDPGHKQAKEALKKLGR
ncbi:hypothetical protein ABI59_17355 [Acidobacteria bacterium Mor1]|nr:hypothetical protein ABI59_17355 [Acidobacteria bacterium Mor1]